MEWIQIAIEAVTVYGRATWTIEAVEKFLGTVLLLLVLLCAGCTFSVVEDQSEIGVTQKDYRLIWGSSAEEVKKAKR